MTKEEKKTYQGLIIKTINKLEKQGHTDIKADIEGYKNPTSFKMKQRRMTITPDVVSVTPNGKTHYVDLGVKSEEPILLKTKWKFLQTLAEMKDRSFRVVTHIGHYNFTDRLIADMNSIQPAMRM